MFSAAMHRIEYSFRFIRTAHLQPERLPNLSSNGSKATDVKPKSDKNEIRLSNGQTGQITQRETFSYKEVAPPTRRGGQRCAVHSIVGQVSDALDSDGAGVAFAKYRPSISSLRGPRTSYSPETSLGRTTTVLGGIAGF